MEEWRQMDEKGCEIQLEKNPTDNEARFRLAEIYVTEEKKLETAQQLIDTIGKADESFMASERKELLGDIEQCSKVLNMEQALVFYKEASDLKPNKIEVYLKLGRTYERIKDFEEAISNFKKALRRNKNCFQALYRMGLVCMKFGQRKEGVKALLRANKIEPDNVNCLVKLAEIYSRDDKKMDQAERHLLRALSIDDHLPEAHLTLGRILDKKGEDDEAIEHFRTASQQASDGDYPKVALQSHFYLGCQYERKKELKQSVYHFKQVLLADQSHFGACVHLAT